jgi:hypothetical protein
MQSASNVPVVLEAAGFSHSDVLQYSLVVLLWSGGEVWQVWRCISSSEARFASILRDGNKNKEVRPDVFPPCSFPVKSAW